MLHGSFLAPSASAPTMGLPLAAPAMRINGRAWSQRAEAARIVPRAVRIGRDDAVSLGHTGYAIAYVLRDLAFAREQLDRALTLNPNLAGAWTYSGWIHLWSGNPTTAIEHLLRSIRQLYAAPRPTGNQP